MKAFITKVDEKFANQDVITKVDKKFANQDVTIRNLEKQVGHIATILSERAQKIPVGGSDQTTKNTTMQYH